MAFTISAAEKEIIKHLQHNFGITEIEATEHHLRGKRELAYIHAQRGNFPLARQLLEELDEWNDDWLDHFAEIEAKKKPKEIIKL